jgi:hypothetical protein
MWFMSKGSYRQLANKSDRVLNVFSNPTTFYGTLISNFKIITRVRRMRRKEWNVR